MRMLFLAGMLFLVLPVAPGQSSLPQAAEDTDGDGLSDATESALLAQFAPRFMVSSDDCSLRPAEFFPFQANPVVQQENGTIYGQAFPRAGHVDQVELHYYHLWRSDCGEMSHNLDAEHVSVLVSRAQTSEWKALYWYAAAHEDTACDASQIARASTVDAEQQGAQVWISRGKHASFLNGAICSHGCGGDSCRDMQPLHVPQLVNLGELHAPMSGATWIRSPQWPLAAKMGRGDFSEERLARVDRLAATNIAWANPGKRPMQAVIHGGNHALGGVAVGQQAVDMALDVTDIHTESALATASTHTGNSLSKAYCGVKKSLRVTVREVGEAIRVK
jgi:hypothetical protein